MPTIDELNQAYYERRGSPFSHSANRMIESNLVISDAPIDDSSTSALNTWSSEKIAAYTATITGPAGPQGPQGPVGADGIPGPSGPAGADGGAGPAGADGLSAYQIAVAEGFLGTEAQWLASLVGPQGPQGIQGVAGTNGTNGSVGPAGSDGAVGPQGPQGIPGVDANSIPNKLLVNGSWNAATNDPDINLAVNQGNGTDLFTYMISATGIRSIAGEAVPRLYEVGGQITFFTQPGNGASFRYDNLGSGSSAVPDADQIAVVPVGNLASVDVQAALEELQDDIDTLTATDIANAPSGNLTGVTVQAALNELQTDIDTLSINDLTDVDTATVAPTPGQTLAWDGTNFVPSTPATPVAPATVVSPEANNPTGAVGVSVKYAREDHKHPAQDVSADAGNALSVGTDGLHFIIINDEVVSNNAALTGAAPAGAQIGVNTTNGDLYYVSAGNWTALPAGVSGLDDVLALGQDLTAARTINTNSNSLVVDTNTASAFKNQVSIGSAGTSMSLNISVAQSLAWGMTASGVSTTVVSSPNSTSLLQSATMFDFKSTNAGVRLRERTALWFGDLDNSNKVGFRAPSTVAVDVLFELPGADGTNGQSLVTNGTGTLSWASPAGPYIAAFNDTTDWGTLAVDTYSITITAATHGKATPTNVLVQQSSGGSFMPVAVDEIEIASNGDVILYVVGVPDLRFAGRVVIS